MSIFLAKRGLIEEDEVDIIRFALELLLTQGIQIVSMLILGYFLGNGALSVHAAFPETLYWRLSCKNIWTLLSDNDDYLSAGVTLCGVSEYIQSAGLSSCRTWYFHLFRPVS